MPGVDKPKCAGVQRLTAEAVDHGPQARIIQVIDPAAVRIERVTQKRKTGLGQVYPDLMGAAGFETQVEQSNPAEPLFDPPAGNRTFAVFGAAGKTEAVGGVAADNPLYPAGIFRWITINQRLVDPFHGMVLELCGEPLVGMIMLGGYKNP